jgi:molybdopterin synthase sulfur carrier subunit
MHWKLFANLAEVAGRKEVPLEETPETVREALDALFSAHPDLEDAVCAEDGDLQDHIRLLVDGEDPFAAGEGYDEPLSGSDELALFPPVSGG